MVVVVSGNACTSLDQVPARLAAIYQSDPKSQGNFERHAHRDLNSALGLLTELPPMPLTPSNLDGWNDNSSFPSPQFLLKNLIRYAPPEAALKEVGEQAIVWAIADMRSDASRFQALLQTLTGVGYDAISLHRAIETARDYHEQFGGHRVPVGMVLGQYRLFSSLSGVEQPLFDTARVLNDARVGETPLSSKRLGQYSISPLVLDVLAHTFSNYHPDYHSPHTRGDQKVWYHLYMDAPTGFLLTFKQIPQAVISFLALDEHTLSVEQLQGVVGRTKSQDLAIHSRGLAPLKFEDALIKIAADFGCANGFTRLVVQSGKANNWISNDAKAQRRYDVPAKRLGLVLGGEGSWECDLPLRTASAVQ